MRSFLALALLAALAGCSADSGDADTSDAAEETAPDLAVGRDVRALERSEVTIGAAAASAGGGGVSGASSATTSAVRSSNTAVQRVFSEFNARQTAGGLVLTLPENVLFDFDAAALRPEAEAALAKIQTVLAEYADAPVEVVGHTDSKGEDAYNQTLSTQRAQAVVAWLGGHSVAASRLTAVGRGEAEPVAENEAADGSDDPAGRQKNRRVEIVVKGVSGEAEAPTGGQPTSTVRTVPTP